MSTSWLQTIQDGIKNIDNSPEAAKNNLNNSSRLQPSLAQYAQSITEDPKLSPLGIYKLRLWNADELLFEHWLPEQFEFSLDSEWASPYATALSSAMESNSIVGGAAALTGAAYGLTPRFRWATMQFWQGNSPVSFQFNLEMRAEYNPIQELIVPFLLLSSLALPVENKELGGVLIAPATGKGIDISKDILSKLDAAFSSADVLNNIGDAISTIKNGIKFGGDLHLQIGRFLTIKDVILKTVSPSFPTRMSKDGIPTEMNLQLAFETRFTPTAQEVIDWFQNGETGGPGAGAGAGDGG